MATKKITEKKMRSDSAEAKKIIRREIGSYYSPSRFGEGRSALENMQQDAEAAKSNLTRYERTSDYKKGANLVDRGEFAYAYEDQRKMLGKIYGKKTVQDWKNDKVHETYKHLIGREYEAMLREHEKAAAKKPKKK